MPTDRQIMNARAAELNDDPEQYFVEMKTAWMEMMELAAENYFDRTVSENDDRPNVVDFGEELDEEFEFQSYEDWFTSEVSSAADSYGDMKYEQMRDEKDE